MNKTTKHIIKYLIEIIIVAFGVFLGTYFSDASAQKKLQADKERAMQIISKELAYNRKMIQEHVTYHEAIKVQIDSIFETLSEEDRLESIVKTKKFQQNQVKGWRGLLYARVQKTGFEGAKLSGVVKEFDIELIQKLSNIYSLQDIYSDFGASILNKGISMNSSAKVIDFIGVTQLMTSDLLGLEKRLLKELDEMITVLEKSR